MLRLADCGIQWHQGTFSRRQRQHCRNRTLACALSPGLTLALAARAVASSTVAAALAMSLTLICPAFRRIPRCRDECAYRGCTLKTGSRPRAAGRRCQVCQHYAARNCVAWCHRPTERRDVPWAHPRRAQPRYCRCSLGAPRRVLYGLHHCPALVGLSSSSSSSSSS